MLALLGATMSHAQTSRPPAPRLQVAQGENLSAGKTPAQLFASDCSACHRSPAGLAKGRGPGQIASFLVEHYTSSRQSAGMLGAYVASIRGPAPAAAARAQPAPSAERPSTGPRPPAELPDFEQGLLPGERNLERPAANGQPQRPTGTVARGRAATPPAAQRSEPAAQCAEPAATAEPEIRAEAAPSSPPAPKTLENLEVYD